MRVARLIDLAGNPVTLPDSADLVRFAPPVKTEYPDLATWREARNLTIGGSEAAAVLGLHPYLSPYELYMIKAGLVEPDQEETEILEWGRRLEAPIVEAYEEKTHRKVTRHGIHTWRHPEYPISVSLDGEIDGASAGHSGPGCLEVKTTSAYTEKELQAEIPIEYQIQMQHEMGVMGWRWASLAVLLLPARKLRYQDLERNDEFIEMLFQRELEFIKRIENNDPPAADGTDSASNAIKRLFPRDTGEATRLPDEALFWTTQIEQHKADIKKHEAQLAEYENKIKAAIGENTFGILPDGTKWSWKLQKRDEYFVKATEFRVLRKLK